jgi:hypothetical protein
VSDPFDGLAVRRPAELGRVQYREYASSVVGSKPPPGAVPSLAGRIQGIVLCRRQVCRPGAFEPSNCGDDRVFIHAAHGRTDLPFSSAAFARKRARSGRSAENAFNPYRRAKRPRFPPGTMPQDFYLALKLVSFFIQFSAVCGYV